MENFLEYISIDPEIRFGKPCIKGTRIAVLDVLQWYASGMTLNEILEDYPHLNEQQIRAALAFAAQREYITKIIPS
jgi:uncharacterized protein (DUF433 family)